MKLLNLVNRNTRGVQPRRVIAALLVSSLLVQPALAQSTRSDPAEAQQAPIVGDINAMVAGMTPSALLAVDQNRGSIIDTIVNQWRTELGAEAMATELRASLSALRADNLLAASNARTFDGLKKIFAASDAISKASANTKADGQKMIGSLTSDTTYTPITPCKLVDTRGTAGYTYAGGAFTASQKRTYDSYGGCGPTVANMTAIQVSVVTQYTGAGGGILSMMANGAAAPITNVFYFGYAPVTTTVPVNGVGSGGLFDVQISGVTGADLVVEVVGYFAAPTPTQLQCITTATTSVGLTSGPLSGLFYGSVSAPACAAGYSSVSVNCLGSNIVVSLTGASGATCYANAPTNVNTLSASQTCCRVPGR